MALNNAYFIKGFVLANNPPVEICNAIDAVIASLADAHESQQVTISSASGCPYRTFLASPRCVLRLPRTRRRSAVT